MTVDRKRQALGKGLGALIPGGQETAGQGELMLVPIEEVFPNPGQPRLRFEEGALQELAESIKEQGVLQPLLVRRVPGGFELVAGERRLRASRLAGLERVPVLCRRVEDERKLELALIENIQRENLNPVEEAQAYSELQSINKYTQEEVARRVGKDRATVANALRLLSLPDFVKQELVKGTISAGHARALVPLKEDRGMRSMLANILKKGLSVRDVERAVARRIAADKGSPVEAREETPELKDLENRLTRKLGCRVRVHPGSKGGRLEIRYADLQELNSVVGRILKVEG
ncbi:MAG: ParB/RepB/Spo0J family partition protein [Pseudomonadota bacterium]|jgi:ParB family chromosome partitioning protein